MGDACAVAATVVGVGLNHQWHTEIDLWHGSGQHGAGTGIGLASSDNAVLVPACRAAGLLTPARHLAQALVAVDCRNSIFAAHAAHGHPALPLACSRTCLLPSLAHNGWVHITCIHFT